MSSTAIDDIEVFSVPIMDLTLNSPFAPDMTSAPGKLPKRLVPRDGPAITPDCLSIDNHASSLKPQSISFLQLPREIRDLVYAEILATSKGIQFSPYAIHPHGPPRRYHLKGKDVALAESEHQAANAWLPTTILRVNRQIAEEAAETLYGKNSFIFRPPLDHAVQFLSALPPQHLQAIRQLTLQKRLFMPLHFDNTPAWKNLYPIIKTMALHVVSISPPLEPSIYDPVTTTTPAWRLRTLLADDAHQFWWPTAKFFASLLMSPQHPLKKIRLVWASFEDKGVPCPPRLREDDLDVEALRVIKILRVPTRQGDELVEDEILKYLKQSGRFGYFKKHAWADWQRQLEVRDPVRHEFVVKRERDKEGGRVVLALTPPTSVAEKKTG